MTITKMIKELKEFRKISDNKTLFEIYDDFLDAYNEVEQGKEEPKIIITLDDIIDQFEKREGILFEAFSQSSAIFREKFQWIKETKYPKHLHPVFEESKKMYVQKWEKENPGKIYEVELERVKKQRKENIAKRYKNYLPFVTYASPYFKLMF